MISIWDWGVRAFYVVAGNVSALSYTDLFLPKKSVLFLSEAVCLTTARNGSSLLRKAGN